MKEGIRLFFCFITVQLCAWHGLSQGLDTALSQKIDKEVLRVMKEGDIPGLTMVVIRHGKEEIKSYGYADLANKIPVTPATLFELGSCSKAFTALAVLRLVDGDSLSLDDRVTDYLPWFSVKYKNDTVPVTVRQLLHHTSGIPWHTISSIPVSGSHDALEQTVKGLAGQDLANAPGKKYEYATVNYDILALIIERITRIPFEDYLVKNVIHALKLPHTSIGTPVNTMLMARGYKIGFFRPIEYQAPVFKGNNAAGYVISNGPDIARWLKFHMGADSSFLFRLARQSHQRDETVPLHGMSAYAMGWEVSLDGTGKIFHAGLNPNYAAYMAFLPHRQLGVAILTNSNRGLPAVLGDHVLEYLKGESVTPTDDTGDFTDKLFTIVAVVSGIYILIVVGLLMMALAGIVGGKRKFESISPRKIGSVGMLLVLLLPFVFGLYIIPEAMLGFTWTSLIIWAPLSCPVAAALVLTAFAISVVLYAINLIFPEPDKLKSEIPKLLLLSILSGIANMIVIVLITSSLNSNVALKYMIFYYALTACVYLLGRRFVQSRLIRISREVTYELRVKLIDRILFATYQDFEKIDRGKIYTALNDDVQMIGDSANMFIMLITSVITSIGAFFYLATIAFWATTVTVLLVILISFIYYIVSTRADVYFERARDTRNAFMRLTNGLIDGFKEISLQQRKKLQYKTDVLESAREHKEKISIANIYFLNAFLVGESMLIVLLGAVAFGIPELFPGIQSYTILSFVLVLLYLIGPINGILGSVPAIMQFSVAWKRIQKFLHELPAQARPDASSPAPVTIDHLHARGIMFQYKNNGMHETFAVGPIHFEVEKGEILFIIGGNGSGKTTLAKLLTGLYVPDEGEILINGNRLTPAQLSECYSAVFSPCHIFEKLYNIDTESRTDVIDRYLKLLNLEDKVAIINQRYTTTDLSGGQRKRLTLLQCYLEDSPIYLFDEWAADQDPGYRYFFYRTLLPEMKRQGKIVIAITHDDHYFDVADKIFKMNQGKLETYLTGQHIHPVRDVMLG